MIYEIKYYSNKILKIISYLPILWTDEDWDYSHLIRLIQFKLKRMEKQLKNGVASDGPSQARRIKIVREHFDRALDIDEYSIPFIFDLDFTNHTDINEARKKYFCNLHSNLEQWHWDQAWDLIKKHGRRWWD